MDIVQWSISRPISVAVGVLLLVMAGLIALGAIPVQLTPTVDRPLITVTTSWAGRSPQEIVDNIVREQEKTLKNVTNLKKMTSSSTEGQAEITLEFLIGSDITRALQEVSDALRQVPAYPADVDEPVIKAADGASGPSNAIAWIIIDVHPDARDQYPDYDVTRLFDPLDKEVKPFLERIDGVAEVNIFGGREREVRVLLDPVRMAQRRISAQEVTDALRRENQNISAGTIDEGRRERRVRVVGQFVDARDVLNTIVAYRPGEVGGSLQPVYVRDLGDVEFGYQKQRGFVRSLGTPAIAMNVIRQSGANVVRVMDNLRDRLELVEQDTLPRLDPTIPGGLRIRQVYDETIYIDSAVNLVTTNLIIGGSIAAAVLLLFLRSPRTTAIIAVAIPISLIGTFLVMVAFGRTINVVSLAGLAFATGMVVDNAVVVLENIYRRLQEGDKPVQAALRGGREVWGAVLASTLTTVAVFVPILTIQEEAGQLFRDIVLAIAAAVTLSLIVSITVVPSAAALFARLGKRATGKQPLRWAWQNLFGLDQLFGRFVSWFGNALRWSITAWRGWVVRPITIVVLATVSIVGSLLLVPPLDYLPQGNRNLVFGGLLIPPGYSLDQRAAIAERIEDQVGPFMEASLDDPESIRALPDVPRISFGPGPSPEPFDPSKPGRQFAIDNFFIGAFGTGMFCGATSENDQVVIPVGQVLTNAMGSIPDTFGGARQSSIFGRGIGGGNTVNMEISGPDLDQVVAAAGMMLGIAGPRFGFSNVQPEPANFNLEQDETRVIVNRRGRELGLRTEDIGLAVRALFDGAYVDDFRIGGDTVDLTLLPVGGRLEYKEQLASIPVATPAGPVVPLDTLVEVVDTTDAQAITRIEELPSVSLVVTPPQGMAVEEVERILREEVEAAAREAGLLGKSLTVRYEGTAASLDEVRQALFGSADTTEPESWQRWIIILSLVAMLVALAVGVHALWKGSRNNDGRRMFWAFLGICAVTLVAAGVVAGFAWQPQLLTARFIWALMVTYLLMCALFESFLYPFVIMFSVPLAVVGGFAGLRVMHEWTLADPTQAPQQLDVVTMLGFVVLIGTVVNNAILIVAQTLNFMQPERFGSTEPALAGTDAIIASVRSRIRPIFMTTCTTLGGMLPLVLMPGAGSEMYRGLGAVVLGGLLCSTVFTLILVPLTLSVALEMKDGMSAYFAEKDDQPAATLPSHSNTPKLNGTADTNTTPGRGRSPSEPAERAEGR